MSTLHVQSHVLKRFNLEILISAINLDSSTNGTSMDRQQLKDVALIPTAETPRSFSGGMSFVTYPVHRAVLVTDGLAGCLTIGRYTSASQEQARSDDDALRMVLNLPGYAADRTEPSHLAPNVSVVDLPVAERALSVFRASVTNATYYEQTWFASNLPALTSWLTSSSSLAADSHGVLPPAITTHISALLADTAAAIATDAAASAVDVEPRAISSSVTSSLTAALTSWSQSAHAELRDAIDAALESPRSGWRRLTWWKLPWRADDVGMHLADVLERAWLVNAEKSLLFLAGRGAQAGLLDLQTPALIGSALAVPLPASGGIVAPTAIAGAPPVTLRDVDAASARVTAHATPLPWASAVAAARGALLARTVPAMQEAAQALLLQTASLAGASGALSTLLHLSVPAASVYEVGAVAALGVVFAVRRLQTRWEGERVRWEGEIREAGRETLREAEAVARAAVERGGGAVIEGDGEAVRERERASGAVEKAQRALCGVLETRKA